MILSQSYSSDTYFNVIRVKQLELGEFLFRSYHLLPPPLPKEASVALDYTRDLPVNYLGGRHHHGDELDGADCAGRDERDGPPAPLPGRSYT